MKIGLVGLGKMGAQIAERLINDGHKVVVTDINPVAVAAAVANGAETAVDRTAMLLVLESRAVVWLMIPSNLVQTEIEAWLQILPAGSILIDGGNSDFRLTQKRAELAAAKGVSLVDVGTSGGLMGRENGFSMMIGGAEDAFKIVEPVIKSLAQPDGYQYFGPAGAGHFIKMTHNAIEYGLMESYAEGYRLLHDGPFKNLDLAAISNVWQHGSIISSSLNDMSGRALRQNPELNGIGGQVAESGETRWTLETAQDLNIPLPAIQASFDIRIASQKGETNFATKLLAAMRNLFGGHSITK